MPSITRSITLMFLAGATTNVLAAPKPLDAELFGVVSGGGRSILRLDDLLRNPKGFRRNDFLVLGICGKLMRDGCEFPDCPRDRVKRCEAMETAEDRRKAEEMCPEIKASSPEERITIWKECLFEKCMEDDKCRSKCMEDDDCKARVQAVVRAGVRE